MFLEFARRETPSRMMVWLNPILAIAATLLVGGVLFALMGYDGFGAVRAIFFSPVLDVAHWEDLALKAAPLILIGLGLAIGFRANVWNIGAEGQYVMGGLGGTAVALATWGIDAWWVLPLMIAAGVLAGLLYAAIPAFLKTRLDVNEILTNLMLSYVAIQLLNYLPYYPPRALRFDVARRMR